MSNNAKRIVTGINGRKLTVLGMVALLAVSAWWLGPGPDSPPWENDGYIEQTLKPFFKAALNPSLVDQSQSLPDDATPFVLRIFKELAATVRYALIAMSLAVPAGMLFGFFASTTWWPDGTKSGAVRLLLRPLHALSRLLITLMRSIHELIWALFFLAAIGNEPITACVALALPFTGTLAKVFSEIIDEQNAAARNQLTASGASPLQAFLTTLLPQSFPDMATYTLYRFECALRSSAVLGFIGVETIGLSIRRSFENNFYNELWTELYLLICAVILVDVLGARLRKRLNSIPVRKRIAQPGENARQTIRRLRQTAPRWKITRVLLWACLGLVALSWFPRTAGLNAAPLTNSHRVMDRSERISRFLDKLTPAPVRESGEWKDALPWAETLWHDPGKEALLNTAAVATAAIILSAFAAWTLLPWASRAFASARPMGLFSGRNDRLQSAFWQAWGFCTRTLFIVSRAVPEYVLAYLLIGLLGVSAWPLVAALALHNFGILGRLWGEVMENQSPVNARQMMQGGASRLQSYFHSIMPESFNRFLMYLFYRWETCVREATVLGMLGFSTLGLHINLARNLFRTYDTMLFFVLLGAAVIFIGDFLSVYLRKILRES